MGHSGRLGCGCLLFLLILCMIAAAVLIHPLSLKTIAGQLRYEDKIMPADAILVQRFVEDKKGELYSEAFREYWAGNGRIILVEEDKLFLASIQDVVSGMAAKRGIGKSVIKAVEAEGDKTAKVKNIKMKAAAMGYRKIIVLVPAYASKRFHFLYEASGSGDHGKVLCIIKPVDVSYFKQDKWWSDSGSRIIFLREIYEMGFRYVLDLKNFVAGTIQKHTPVAG